MTFGALEPLVVRKVGGVVPVSREVLADGFLLGPALRDAFDPRPRQGPPAPPELTVEYPSRSRREDAAVRVARELAEIGRITPLELALLLDGMGGCEHCEHCYDE